MANWASVAEVLALTGATVTDAQITQAQGVMDIFSGTQIESLANLSSRDHRLLRMATAYQTVWQIAQVDVTSRTDVKQLDQDGAKVVFQSEDSLLLAPLARRCLAQLSWRRTGAARVVPDHGGFPNIEAYQAAWLRDRELITPGWQPL